MALQAIDTHCNLLGKGGFSESSARSRAGQRRDRDCHCREHVVREAAHLESRKNTVQHRNSEANELIS